MKPIHRHLFWLFACVSLILHTQERFPINVFLPSDYHGESQNWSISQSKDRYIYAANNKGLLEFNGANWTLYNSPNKTIIRAVKVIDNLIFTGSYHEFGYWKKDNYGVLNYTSLSDVLDIKFLEDEEFWNILNHENWILFQSLDRIHIYNKETKVYSVVNSKTKISRLFKVDEMFFFQSLNNGLYRIENGTEILVSEDEVIRNNVIVNIFNHTNSILILTQDSGFYNLTDNSLSPWDISAKSDLAKVSVFSAIEMRDRSFMLGTISDGIIHLKTDGTINYKINQSDGLSNNTVLFLHEDLDNNIWLGLDNGINCINIKSPYNIYYDTNGDIGSVYTSVINNGVLYLGTNQGLFYRDLYSKNKFNFIENTQGQVWFLKVIDGVLFCGHNSGTFVINDTQAEKIVDIQGAWLIKKLSSDTNLLIQGNYNGLHILHKLDGKWKLRNKLEGFNISSRFFEFINKEEIYVNHEYKGLFKLKVDKELTKVETYNQDKQLEKGLYSSLIKSNKDLLYTNRKGIFKFDYVSKQFKKDTILSRLIDKEHFTSGKLVWEEKTKKLWSFSSKGINFLTESNLIGEKKIIRIPFPVDIRKDVIGYESVTHVEDEKFLLGSSAGYIIFNLNKNNKHKHKININQITVSKLKSDSESSLVDLTKNVELKNNENNLKFSYSISEFSKTQKPEYRYKLEGIYESWSEWTTTGSVLFENLPYGEYTFFVNGRVGNETTLNTESYSFSINRPWFLSNVAIGLYLLGVIVVSFLTHKIYTTYYRNQRKRLMQKASRELELKELENKQQLMRFRNEKLREDIENKNRELGISTMNLIKKNEFLGSIKKELMDSDGTRSLKQIVKIIDRNLNNNDDWNLFQEAFNNADKDFLKKIKELHPNLTSNDLRLCAYLRLNLSSKEIAPLLNISPRSVEVKRYRLRKKIDLSHKSSLTDYILEI
ncbi:triple tyrosine motif-containing protein [uncultured Algibacter sp.]|uniref:helix-turn-helix and ligand-binding sensor domain-containing protein n=1 Tax=uncultured Algibacter sp. TaxID=298659 RepID=UPI0026380971|nr:triple tyrosine motif-containing protein [uncultured Algibacter sp.]